MSIATYIKNDVIAQICSGKLSTGALTLDDLSKRYSVSATPVRVAVQELISEGFLRKSENRRLTVSAERIAAMGMPPEPEQPKDYYKVVADDLIRLSLQGEPVLLREESAAEKYGVGRSSIRMIFHRLAGDGVLKHLPRRGFQLRPFLQKDLDSYIQMREVLELKALDLAWPWLVDADIQAMLDKNRLPEKSGDEPQSDNSLHAYLVEKSQNAYIADFFERHGRYYKVLFDWEGLENKEMIETVRQHRAILEALLRRDRPGAERAMVDHIHNNHPVLMRIVQENSQRQAKMASGKPITSELK